MYIKIPSSIEKCINILTNNGYKGYVVGGCVRDSIIGRKPNDWDICTSATPKELKKVFKDYKTIDTGIQHGTVTIIIDKEFIEVTTFRIDGEYSDNRRPDKVVFTNDILSDLSRRDFTINAMAYNYEEGIIDCFNGKDDINRKIIRCVGNPEKRFKEDALRIMRAFRFMAQLNYRLEKATLEAIENTKYLIGNISVERISVELNKLILSDNPSVAIKIILDMNILSLILPEFKRYNLNENTGEKSISKCTQVIKLCPKDLEIRLTVLFYYWINNYRGLKNSTQILSDNIDNKVENKLKSDMVENILKSLRYDNNTIKNVKILMKYYGVNIKAEKVYVKKVLKIIGENIFRKLVFIENAEYRSYNLDEANEPIKDKNQVELILNEILIQKECYTKKSLKINGNDLTSLGVKKGKIIGEILDRLLDLVIEKPDINNKSQLKVYAKSIYDDIK